MSTSAKDHASGAEPKSDVRPVTEASPAPKEASSRPGRIIHDARGNAVWNWDNGSDPSSTASTSKMLKKLDLANLQVEDTVRPEELPAAKKRGSGYGPGYNPYDRTAPVRVVPKK
jgi:hypothetical protein